MSSPVLQTTALAKAYPSPGGDIPVLTGVEMAVMPGESVSIRGESGSGKTTLLYLISALESPDSGKVLWTGEDVFSKSPNWRARRRCTFMGLVFQAYYLIPELDAYENVLMAARLRGKLTSEDRQRAKELLDRVGLSARMKHTPGKLSGGERQRVALARALLNRPPLVLADEPTGNLDEHTGEDVMNLLLDLCRDEGASLFLVTHNPAFAARTNRQLFLHGGSLEQR